MSQVPISEGDRRAYAANIWKFYLFRWLVNFQLWLPIWVIYLSDHRGLSLTEITVLDAVFWIFLVFMEVPTGAIADRYGRKVSLMIGAFANSIAIAVFAVGDSYPIILASYVAWGIAWTLFSGADSAFFYDSLRALGREADYQKLYGRGFAIQQTGALGGILIGAPLAAWTNLPTPVLLSAVLMAGAWIVSLSFREPPRNDESHATPLGYLAGVREAASIVWHTPAIRYFMFLAATIVAVGMCVSILTQPFLSSHNVNVAHFGWYLVPGNLLGMAAALWAYRVTARFGVNRVIAALPLIVMATSVGLGAFDSLYAFVFIPLCGMVYSFSFPVVSDYLNKRIPSGQRATILSFYQLLFSLMLAPLEPLLGWIADEAGLQAAYRTVAIIVAVGAAPLLALWLRAIRSELALTTVTVPEPANSA